MPPSMDPKIMANSWSKSSSESSLEEASPLAGVVREFVTVFVVRLERVTGFVVVIVVVVYSGVVVTWLSVVTVVVVVCVVISVVVVDGSGLVVAELISFVCDTVDEFMDGRSVVSAVMLCGVPGSPADLLALTFTPISSMKIGFLLSWRGSSICDWPKRENAIIQNVVQAHYSACTHLAITRVHQWPCKIPGKFLAQLSFHHECGKNWIRWTYCRDMRSGKPRYLLEMTKYNVRGIQDTKIVNPTPFQHNIMSEKMT